MAGGRGELPALPGLSRCGTALMLIGDEAGLEGITFHSMRHSWATWHVQGGTPLRMLQELGGWATAEMPLRYAHLDPGHLAQYAETSASTSAS